MTVIFQLIATFKQSVGNVYHAYKKLLFLYFFVGAILSNNLKLSQTILRNALKSHKNRFIWDYVQVEY